MLDLRLVIIHRVLADVKYDAAEHTQDEQEQADDHHRPRCLLADNLTKYRLADQQSD
jgi:hypothetical protein